MSKSNWSGFEAINPTIQKRLLAEGFVAPTEVQQQVIKSYKSFKDFIIASQTGSGKTLAFGIPIISDMLQRKHVKGIIECLIITPTRELAMQIMKHLKPIAQPEISIGCVIGGMSKQKQHRILKGNPRILVATPGRLWEMIESEIHPCLQRLQKISYLVIDEADRMVELGHFDELDKIIEKITSDGQVTHDQEIIKQIMKKKSNTFALKNNRDQALDFEPEEVVEMDYEDFVKLQNGQQINPKKSVNQYQEDDEYVDDEEDQQEQEDEQQDDEQEQEEKEQAEEEYEQEEEEQQEQEWDDEDNQEQEIEVEEQDVEEEEEEQNDYEQIQNFHEKEPEGEERISLKKNKKIRTFLVSATLSQQFIKGSRFKYFKDKTGNKQIQDSLPKLQSLLGKLQIQSKPKIIDLSSTLLFPETLKFLKSEIYEEDDKILYLVQFLRERENQTVIIFLNSILYGKKVASILDVLNIKSVCLHSLQQQRQRLKKLDQFAQRKIKVLVCTDVAARGLDVPNVENVVHYQVPFSADTFVHRCGRTARIGREGQTLCLIGPKDKGRFEKIEQDVTKCGRIISDFKVDNATKNDLRQLISSAMAVEKQKHSLDKKSRIKDSIKQKLMNKDIDQDDEDLRKELEHLEEEIVTKKRILNQQSYQYQTIVKQREQPDNSKYNRNRRNALFLTPDQIAKLQEQLQSQNTRIQDQKKQTSSTKNKMNQKRQRKFKH